MTFPNNIVDVLSTHLARIDGVEVTFTRALRITDPDASLGVFEGEWRPGDHVIGQDDPQVSTFSFIVQFMVKHTDLEVAREFHTGISKTIRTMLYRDADLRLALVSLNETEFGVLERVQRFGVREQRFLSNELSGEFLRLSTTELWVEIEAT